MSVCVVIQSGGIVATGSDVTPAAIAWANINETGDLAVTVTTSTQSLTAIDTPITLRATWTTSGHATLGYWIVNGAAIAAAASSPVNVTVNNNATLAFTLQFTAPTGARSASGTVTVTNQSDGGATLDTFTYFLEQTGGTA